jgi:hypothetical protein
MRYFRLMLLFPVGLSLGIAAPARALPPADEIPEEILRTEIITAARSPIDGEPLTAAEYAALEVQLRDPNRHETVSPEVAQIIFLLQIRRGLKPVFPFIP